MSRITTRNVLLDYALAYEPFAGDETDVSVLADKIVTAAKEHPRCQICESVIHKGERHRARTERNNENRTVATFRFCQKCTRAMAHPETYTTARLINSRYTLGDRRRRVA